MGSEQLDDPGRYLYEQIRRAYIQDIRPPSPYQKDHQELEWEDFKFVNDIANNAITVHSEATRARLREEKCDEMYMAVCRPDGHFENLDLIFSSLLRCEWHPGDNSTESVIQRTFDYITRGLQEPSKLPDFSETLHEQYFVDKDIQWSSLQVVTRLSLNSIRIVVFAVLMEGTRSSPDNWIHQMLNWVGGLIDVVVAKSRRTSATVEKQRWFIVRSFLWTFWQRCRVFFAFRRLKDNVRHGADHDFEGMTWLRNFAICESMSLRSFTNSISDLCRPANLCSWAVEFLLNDFACLGLPFDLFYHRYTAVMSKVQARCSKDGVSACDGLHPDHCLRYRGLEVEDQSMHDYRCRWSAGGVEVEPKICWNEKSYRAVVGARAVKININEDHEEDTLTYCRASSDTIAISHVWSHGQGGRPETGINQCLHRRFSSIARRLGCTSYWLDTTCIPTEHNLRREAIEHINEVFYQSRAVLICDKDLMTIDVSMRSLEFYESIISVLLMSDWNSRAWTILEGLKGRKRILILFKENKLLTFQTIVQEVVSRGRMEIVAFAQQLLHLVPWIGAWRDDQPFTLARRGLGTPWVMESEDQHPFTIRQPYRQLPIEVIGSWLSCRPASRSGDAIIIWSLLPGRGSRPIYDACEFWRQQKSVRTGFLLSSAERLTVRGLTWAPCEPYVLARENDNDNASRYYRPTPGHETTIGSISRIGLEAQWDMHQFGLDFITSFKREQTRSRTDLEISNISTKFMRKGRLGAVLQPISSGENYAAVITKDVASIPIETKHGYLVAICESNGKTTREGNRYGTRYRSYRWTWRGVYEWPKDVPLPAFKREHCVWIA